VPPATAAALWATDGCGRALPLSRDAASDAAPTS
jgi:hypothetical protein